MSTASVQYDLEEEKDAVIECKDMWVNHTVTQPRNYIVLKIGTLTMYVTEDQIGRIADAVTSYQLDKWAAAHPEEVEQAAREAKQIASCPF